VRGTAFSVVGGLVGAWRVALAAGYIALAASLLARFFNGLARGWTSDTLLRWNAVLAVVGAAMIAIAVLEGRSPYLKSSLARWVLVFSFILAGIAAFASTRPVRTTIDSLVANVNSDLHVPQGGSAATLSAGVAVTALLASVFLMGVMLALQGGIVWKISAASREASPLLLPRSGASVMFGFWRSSEASVCSHI
jgi:hypothetical protein